jgi:hypothetical protein
MVASWGRYEFSGSNNVLSYCDDVILEAVDAGPANSIGYLKDILPDGFSVGLSGKQITSPTLKLLPGEVGYIEEPDRSAGIRVLNSTDADWAGCGDMINVEGVTATTPEGERYIDVTNMGWAGDVRPIPALGMNLRFANTNLANGLYVKLTGQVTEVGADYFVITDGSVDAGGAPITAKVVSGTLPLPSVGQTVRARGVLSTDGASAVLVMNDELVEWVTGTASIHPLPFPGPVQALRDYLMIGTFGDGTGDMTTQLATDYLGGEAAVRPSLGDVSGGKTWFRYDGLEEIVNLNRVFPDNTFPCTAYAHVYVWSPDARVVDMVMSTDDSAKIWVNGTLVYEFNGIRDIGTTAYGVDCVSDVPLAAGLNSVLIKIVKGENAGFGLTTQFAVIDSWTGGGGWGWGNSTPMPDLGYLLNQQ